MSIKLRYLGWSCFLIEGRQRRILVDPWLAGYPEHDHPQSPLQKGDFGDLDVICVTHAADDHYGVASALALETGAMLFGGMDIRLRARADGIEPDRIGVLVSGATYIGDGWRLKALQAQHVSMSLLDGHYLNGQPLSYVLEVDGVRIWHGGDTSLSMDHQLFGRLYQPDVALVGVGGAVFQGGRPITELEPREAAMLVQWLGAGVAVPMHYLADQADGFVAAMAEICPDVRLEAMDVGDTLHLGPSTTVDR